MSSHRLRRSIPRARRSWFSAAVAAAFAVTAACGVAPPVGASNAAAAPASTAPGANANAAAVEQALARMTAAKRRNDLPAALAAVSEAVDLDPVHAIARMERVGLLMQMGPGTEPAEKARREAMLRGDLRAVIAIAPSSTVAGLARDTLATLEGQTAAPPDRCPPAAQQELAEAERLFGLSRYADALPHYEAAAVKCPDNAAIWTDYGDTWFRLGDLARAQAGYEKALAKDPWYGPAHRFLADVEGRQKNVAGAYRESILAVVSNPAYEAAWGYLRSIIESRHGTWNRVQFSAADRQSLDAAAAGASGFERRRSAVRKLLSGLPAGAAPSSAAFWNMMQRADQAGFLDEAIFLHLSDVDLLEAYPAFRAAHSDRLVRYVETVLAPLPAKN